jgi:hypothetical protein
MSFIRPQRGCCAHVAGGPKLFGTSAPAPAFHAWFILIPSHPGVAEASMSGFRRVTPAKSTANLFMMYPFFKLNIDY